MMKAGGPCCGVAIDIPLTQDELEGHDDHAANIWRLVVDLCSSTTRVIMPRRSSASKSDDDTSRHLSSSMTQSLIYVIASEVDPQSFTSVGKANCLIFKRDKMSYSKQTVTSKLLTLLGRRTKKSSTDVLSERTERSDRSPSPVSLSAELSHSDSDSLAAYASSEPAAWKKVQAFVLKNDRYSIEQCNGRFVKPLISPSSPSKSKELAWERARDLSTKSEIDPQKGQCWHSDEDLSKSFNENFNLLVAGSDFQPSPLSSEGVVQSSSYLSSSIIPFADDKPERLGVISDLFVWNEKEDIDEGFDPTMIRQQVTQRQEVHKSKTAPFISSLRSTLRRLRQRRPISKTNRTKMECDDEEPSLTISRSSSIDVTHRELINMAV